MVNDRREAIIGKLRDTPTPLTGADLADNFGVSRQAIVTDIAVLRARGEKILATPKGYQLDDASKNRSLDAQLAVRHRAEDTREELLLLVDAGVRVVDVTVEHPLYGDLRGNLFLKDRRDVEAFARRVQKEGISLLSELTGGVHLHRVEFDAMAQLERARALLREAGFLAEE
ncbi:MAG: transcription repressor NadR [Bacillota bacterium]